MNIKSLKIETENGIRKCPSCKVILKEKCPICKTEIKGKNIICGIGIIPKNHCYNCWKNDK